MIAGTWSINEFIRKEPVLNGTVALNSTFCMPGYFLIEEDRPDFPQETWNGLLKT